MKLSLLILLAFIVSCSSTQKKAKQGGLEYDEEKNIDVPAWVYSISDVCDTENYLCASSEGDSSLKADLNAKKALASILEVRVTASSDVKRFGLTSIESKGLTEKVLFETKEEVDVVLKGAQILKRFKKDEAFYSYAVLEKKPAQKIIKSKLEALDSKIESLYSQKKRVFVNRLLVLLAQRDALAQELILLDGKYKTAPISFEQIYTLKNSKLTNGSINIDVKNNAPTNLVQKIEEELTSMGFILTKAQAKNNIEISFKTDEEYLNVKGFKKYSFILDLKSFDTNSRNLGVLSIKKITTGRSKRDALNSVIKQIINEMKINLEKLNI